MKKEYYELWFCSLPGVGSIRGSRLLALCGQDPERLYHAPDELWKQVLTDTMYEKVKGFTARWRLQEEFEKLAEAGICLVTLGGEHYPEKLRHIPDAPTGLFFRGKLPGEEALSVAVIGARECSPYGKFVAKELGKELGERKIPLISGMARGIDGISEEAALEAGGTSYAVLGCGVDVCYPPGNRKLYEQLLEQGGILSPYPPGTLPRPGNFPPRNRIVSGLADAVVVIEARSRSGTLITVDMALEQGREVYVVPGRVTDRLSDGCNRLLKQGARVFLSPEEFLEELCEETAFARMETHSMSGNFKTSDLPDPLSQICSVLDFSPQSLEEIKDRLSFPCTAAELGSMLITLCMKGRARQTGPGYFCIGLSEEESRISFTKKTN